MSHKHNTKASRSPRHLDPAVALVAGAASVNSVANYLHYLHKGQALAYVDSMSHLLISRRIIDSPTPGVSQSGGVWPALIHWVTAFILLVAQPFDPHQWLYYTGTAGSIISMICYVGTAVVLYKTSRMLTHRITGSYRISQLSSLIAPVILLTNPNASYMQATPMTELPLIFGMSAAVYCLLRWSQQLQMGAMAGLILAVFWASGTRYEGWALWATIAPIIGYVALRSSWAEARLARIKPGLDGVDGAVSGRGFTYPLAKTIDFVTYYTVFAGLFIPGWMVWNRFIIQTGWLGFIHSEYASPANWVRSDEPSKGHAWIALKTYWLAMVHINGLPLMVVGAVGLAVFLLTQRLDPRTVGVLALVYPLPFFWLMLWGGQRPLHVPEISGDIYNVRFALQTLPFFALMGTIMTAAAMRVFSRWRIDLAVLAAALVCVLSISPQDIITLDEPMVAQQAPEAVHDRQTAQWLQQHYTGGRILMATPTNEEVLFLSRLPLNQVIYEGTNSRQMWQQALAHPATYVAWILMRRTPGNQDKVYQVLGPTSPALNDFGLVYQTADVLIYHRLPDTNPPPAPS